MVHRYSFAPMVYREHWTNAAGEDSGFYVISYTVGGPCGRWIAQLVRRVTSLRRGASRTL